MLIYQGQGLAEGLVCATYFNTGLCSLPWACDRFCGKLCPVSYVPCVFDSKTCGCLWFWTSQETWLSLWEGAVPAPDLVMGCWAEAHSPQLQSGSKLPCFAAFSHHCVMLRLACPCTGTRGMGPIRVTHRLLLASSQHLWRHVFSAPGSHTYLWPSLPLISRFSRHPSGMAGENSTRHLVCDSTFPSGVSNRPLLPSAQSCLLSHLIANLDVHSRVWEMSPCHLTGCCVPVVWLWTDVWLGEVLIRCMYLWPHHLSCLSAGLPQVS